MDLSNLTLEELAQRLKEATARFEKMTGTEYSSDLASKIIEEHEKRLASVLLACKTPEELQQVSTTPEAVKKLEGKYLTTTDTNRILSVIDPNYDW